ncbi:MAG: AGE family epimerase/isomerase [Rikenellaceae bacterium]
MHDIEKLKGEVKDNLRTNILEFWQRKMFCAEGGFYGAMLSDGTLLKDAPRGAVLNARILWSFSAAYRILGDKEYLQCATHAKEYLLANFYNADKGTLAWSVDHTGALLDTKNQFYALGFAIYALSEYNRATGDEDSLKQAKRLFHTIEEHSYVAASNGYIEARKGDWSDIEDLRLSEKDDNAPLTMNTHLHILEAYTNLYRVWKSDEVKVSLERLINIFTDKIYNPATGHLSLFFDMEWRRLDGIFSYGHDIEASWLLLEAAQVLGDKDLEAKVMPIVARVAEVSKEGLQEDGSMIYERHANGELDTDRHWWVQAESVVGLMWLAKYHGDTVAEAEAIKCWEYIKREIVDHNGGEWWWSRREDGSINMSEDKAGMWKCPYHNSRMCLEVLSL